MQKTSDKYHRRPLHAAFGNGVVFNYCSVNSRLETKTWHSGLPAASFLLLLIFTVFHGMLLQGMSLTTAWVGDSRAVLGRRVRQGQGAVAQAWEAVALSKDHKPTHPTEQKRISSTGGRIQR